MDRHDATEIAFKNGYKKAAREIFEEIEKYMVVFGDRNLSSFFRGISYKAFAELKKKYTENENDRTTGT